MPPVPPSPQLQREGQAHFQVGPAFYRSHSKTGRDLAILAATVYRQRVGQLRVLDAMTGCGVRPLRYHLEAQADWIWANEGNPDLQAVLQQNLAAGMRSPTYQITHQDANQVFFTCYQNRDFYDLVDVDSFGGGMPYLSTALWATKFNGLVYLTNTDTRTTSGHNLTRSLQLYGASARSHPAVHEQGVRLLIGCTLQQAAARGLAVEPVFSFFNGQVHRIMLRLTTAHTPAMKQFGFLGYCHRCGHFKTLSWRQLGRATCPRCAASGPASLVVSGPLWLGHLHDRTWLSAMMDLAQRWHWTDCVALLEIMSAEATLPPYYFTLPEIGRHGQTDIPKRDRLLAALREQGFAASRTHFEAQAVKTDADIGACIAAAKACS